MKRILALLLALAMLLALTACGKDEEGTPIGESTGATTNTTESTNDPTDGAQDSTQGTTEETIESTTGGETTVTTEPSTTPPSVTTLPTTPPPATTTPTTPPATYPPSTNEGSQSCKHINTRDGNCINELYCLDCSTVVGPKNPNIHPEGQAFGLYNVKAATCAEEGYTGDWKCQSCHALVAKGSSTPKLTTHTGGRAGCTSLAICSICGASYGNYDKTNHARANGKVNWETRNKVEATCENGYSGDIYCLDCGKIVSQGKVLPAIGCVSADAIPATCCTYRHCSRCGQVWEWMGYDSNNHTGATEIRNSKDATCCKGYSGDTYCLACNKICSKGHDIAPVRDHSWQVISTGMYQCKECGTVEIRVGS